ncbi:MAG: RNA-directed DNA polymerase [Saprospiraceae bacterium]|nr:RNA-directed DNA polymerase [Candidatus Vicinibacter affinis]
MEQQAIQRIYNFMNREQTHIIQIRAYFEKMQTRQDFLYLLNKVKPYVYGGKAIPFELKQLTWYSNPKLAKNRYNEFKIKKKSGLDRSIHAPVRGLKSLQKALSYILHCVYLPHKAAMGFVWGKSVVENARVHEGSNYVYNVDLKDFFTGIDQARVWKCLQLSPFNLNERYSRRPNYPKLENSYNAKPHTDENVGCFEGGRSVLTNNSFGYRKTHQKISMEKDKFIHLDEGTAEEIVGKWQNNDKLLTSKLSISGRQDICNIIASLCCTAFEVERQNDYGEWVKLTKSVLPQGAPTSPIISNIVCYRLDQLLTGVAKRFGLLYSRYADDITFSSNHNVYQQESDFIRELHRIIADQGFHIKESKTRLQKSGYRKVVTGLLVNEKTNVQHRYIKQLRMWLYYWERYGYERASGFFLQQYIADKGHVKNGKPDIANVIAGKLDYLKMVKGADNELYLKLKSRFDLLIGFEDPINKVLNIWEIDGVEKAMDFYYKDKLE